LGGASGLSLVLKMEQFVWKPNTRWLVIQHGI